MSEIFLNLFIKFLNVSKILVEILNEMVVPK
jgi:hypothetical protein